MKTKLVILDWAGTTVDYGCFAPVNAFALAFRTCGMEPTVEEIREPMGMLKRDHIRTMLTMPRLKEQWESLRKAEPDEAAVEEIYGVFEASLMKSLADYAAPKPGTLKAVRELREMGISIGSTTGYTDAMMEIVTRGAAGQGYEPDFWITPDGTDGLGRPYPYMIFENMRHFRISSVEEVVKVGDTVSDIREGKQAGVRSIGVLEGSSALGLTEAEYEALSHDEKEALLGKVQKTFLAAGADDVLLNIGELPKWLSENTF
jgi:phosphonoacetaldehyde hydrolase